MEVLVTYPEIKGATDIIGWVSNDHQVVNLKVGDKTFLNSEVAGDLARVFPFLKVKPFDELEEADKKSYLKEKEAKVVAAEKVQEEKEVAEEVKKTDTVASKEVTEKPKQEKSLKKRAVELGVFKFGMTTKQLLDAIHGAETAEN